MPTIVAEYDQSSACKIILKKMKTQEISFKSLADGVGSSKSVLHKLLNGKTERIDLSLIKKIVEYLNLDYRNVLYPNPMDYIEPGHNTLDIIKRLFEEIGVSSYTDIASMLNFTNSYVTNIYNGNANITENFITKCSTFFCLSQEHILGKKKIDIIDVISKIDLKKKTYKYPILEKLLIFVWPDIIAYLDFKKMKYIEYDIDLGEKGYFYKINTDDYFPNYNKDDLLAILHHVEIVKDESHYIAKHNNDIIIVAFKENKIHNLSNGEKIAADIIGKIKAILSH